MTVLRAVLDTSVLVSGLAYPSGNPGRILAAWRQGGLQVVLSRYILDETARVLPRFQQLAMTEAEIRDLVDSFIFLADIVEPDMEAAIKEGELRDPADRQILGTLLASRASYLITGDKDLLALAERYPIITAAQFWQRHGG
jgi:putative PIN family toxin of toxin-antitoxin system